jgi:hypothetical protein
MASKTPPVLDLVPLPMCLADSGGRGSLGRSRRQLLQFEVAEPHPPAIRAAAVGGDPEFARMRIALSSHAFEPAADRPHGELGGVARNPDADEAGIGDHIVHCQLLSLEVVYVHAQWRLSDDNRFRHS